MFPTASFDVAALVLSSFLLVTYHIIYLFEVYFEHNEVFGMSINSRITDLWVDKYFDQRNPEAMMEVIHCLRNTVLIAIFLGGYSLESSYSMMAPQTLGFIPTGGVARRTSEEQAEDEWVAGFGDISRMVLIVCLFSSFICWLQVLRNCIHLGYVIDGWDGPVIPYESITADPNVLPSLKIRATCPVSFSLEAREKKFSRYAKFLARNVIVYFGFAFRFIYVSIPFAFYALGSAALLASTCVILVFEILWDYQLV
jgi:hypothetical protein